MASREAKGIKVPRAKSQGNDMMLIINGCKRSWSGSESHPTVHQDEKKTHQKANKIASLFY